MATISGYIPVRMNFTIGYNERFIRIKDEASDSYLQDAEISWMPVLQMTEMMHSCPKWEVSKTESAYVHSGFVVFQMPGNANEYGELGLEYSVNGQTLNATERIEVNAPADGKKRSTFLWAATMSGMSSP